MGIAFASNPRTGRFTFARNAAGRLYFDQSAVYPVLATLYARKGQYYWDSAGTQGTQLYTVTQDKLATGSQLTAYATDGLTQVQRAGFITSDYSVGATRLRTGSWRLDLGWTVAGTKRQREQQLVVLS
jgi:hypothetical protein